jgi:hypothetical protein
MKFYPTLEHQNLSGIEKLLRDNLVSIRPRPEFVAELRQKLVEMKPAPPVLPRGWRTVLVSTAGVFSGLLIVGAAVRTLAGLIGMLNLVKQVKPPKAKRATSAAPA